MTSTITGAKVIVVGGGLAGLSAAHTVLERGGRCLVLDKKDFLGGNSVKATSGINGALTNTQIKLGIPDSAALFERDTALSANKGASADSTPLIHTLTYESGPAVEWLIDSFGLDLSLISRLGGHSQPRTHRGKERFPGMTITYALMEKFENLASHDPTRAQIIVNASVQRLLTDDKGAVTGVEYEHKGKRHTEHGPVIIATGGFGADFSDNSILKQVRPDLMHLPTTNGDHCTGDGIKMSTAIGGATIDLPAVQVHPTGLVNPKEPDAKIKFLAAEALRGVGGLLLDANGKRFCNELGTRDYVTGEMWKNKGPFRLVLNSKGVKEIEWHCKHYVGRGLMRHFRSGAELAKEIGVSPDVIAKTFQTYNAHEKAGDCPYGKKYFQNMPFDTNDEFHVAIVTPVVHYCMGGVQIDEHAQILRDGGKAAIPGLFAAGEVCGGVHGKNRLGGSGLLGAVVYGRVAGASSSKYLLQQLSSQTAHRRVGQVLGQLFNSITIQPVSDGLVIKLGTGSSAGDDGASSGGSSPASLTSSSSSLAAATVHAAATTASPAAPTTAASSKLRNDITMEEVAKHNTDKDCWVVVNGTVLDATTFLDKHPGGRQSILLFAGKDASEEFNMLHKPDVITKYAPDIILGTLKK